MAPRKHSEAIRSIIKDWYEGGMTPLEISNALDQPPHDYQVDVSTIQRWAKAGSWISYRVKLSQMPQSIFPDPAEYPLYHLCALEAEKAANIYPSIEQEALLLDRVNMEYRPGRLVLQWLKNVYLPHYRATGKSYDPSAGYAESYGITHQPLASNQVDFDFAMIPDMEESMERERDSLPALKREFEALQIERAYYQQLIDDKLAALGERILKLEGPDAQAQPFQAVGEYYVNEEGDFVPVPLSEELKAEIERLRKEGESEET